MWWKQGFCLFPAWLFGGYDGCESGDRGCGWCDGVGWFSGVGVVEVVCGVKMGVRRTFRSTCGGSVEGRKGLNGLHRLAAFSGVGSKVLMPLLRCEGVFLFHLR